MINEIIGMAKSYLNLKGAKAPCLELDFFKLAYAVKNSANMVGFILVLTSDIEKRVNGWISKYETGVSIKPVLVELTQQERTHLMNEKEANRKGTNKSRLDNKSEESIACYGSSLCEQKLNNKIMMDYPYITRINNKQYYPLNINWDFYGRNCK
jgi:hypothetical protein